MKLVDYEKYTRKWSPRSSVVMAVTDGIVTGFFLGATLYEYLRGRNELSWIWPAAMAFLAGVGTLLSTLVALHNCPRKAQSQAAETTAQNARA